MLTLKAPVDFNPRAVCPQWDAFLARVQPDPEIRSYLQRITGYSATGSIREQVFFLHHGTGANGKSVFHDVVMHVLGSYVQSVPVEALMASGADRIPNDIARMVGRRYLTASETKAGRFLDEQRLKQLTGGDTISARFMRGEYFEFKPVGKVHLITNQLPRLSEDSATWRRIHLISWGEVIPQAERDGLLAERLIREESEGILRWIVEGATQWFAIGLAAPGQSVAAKEEYERDEQTLGQWIEQECEIFEVTEETRLVTGGERSVLYGHYKVWMTANGFQPVNSRNFHSEMKTKGFQEAKSHGRRGYLGITVRMDIQG
jgi:putative DNA primase/helicase